jgi:hypothetical protein
MTMLFAAMHDSANGTFETCRDVRYSVAIRGKDGVIGRPQVVDIGSGPTPT